MAQARLGEEICGRLEAHFQEGVAVLIHADSVERTVLPVVSHEIGDEAQMSVVDGDAVSSEDTLDFFDDAGARGFDLKVRGLLRIA